MDKSELKTLKQSLNLEAKFWGLDNLSERYTLFYDETNNIRKLHITEQGKLNVAELSDFVLGGIVCKQDPQDFNVTEFRSLLKIDRNVKDIKLKHIAKGEFLNAISSRKLNFFLKWIIGQGLLTHFTHLDPLFWSLADIIDSALPHLPELTVYHFNLKSDLHEIAKADIEYLVAILAKFEYPNVIPKNIRSFSEELLTFIERGKSAILPFNYQMLKGMFQKTREMQTLEFIEGYNSGKLIENFDMLYLRRILMFHNSMHIFDEEPQISSGILGSPLVLENLDCVKFVKSEDSFGIQIADVLVGIIGKFYSWIRNTKLDSLPKALAEMSGLQKENLDLIGHLFTISEIESKAFIHHVASINDLDKSRVIFEK